VLGRAVGAVLGGQVAWRRADATLGAWYRAWGWLCFTRPVAVGGTLLGLVGALLYLAELQRGRYDPFGGAGLSPLAVALLAALAWLGLAIHELGHALAVKHAGRSVWSAGVMLYYGLPAGYVDTTDIWMAPRRQRMVVSVAGPWTELVLGGICGLAAFALPEGPVGAFAFTWSGVLLLEALLQFWPLLELDGYYLLVDLLEQPMLRARSLAFVRGPLWVALRERRALSTADSGLALFGLSSAASSVLALLLAAYVWEQRLRWITAPVPQ
jgi:putative peptide zinc metalloprotease protein